MRRGTASEQVAAIGLIGILAVLMLYPIWLTVAVAFEPRSGVGGGDGWFTLYHVGAVFVDPALRAGLINSGLIAACTTVLALIIALPLAIVGARYEFPGKPILSALILLPMILPPFVGAIGLRHIFGRGGSVNSLLQSAGLIDGPIDFLGVGGFWAVVIVEALSLYPILYLNIVAALANLDPALDEAARNVGVGRWTRLFRITLPLIRPGVFAGATIVFIWSFTELGTPLMFEYHTVTPVQIFSGVKEMTDSRQPYALTVVMLAFAVGLYWLGKSLFGGKAYAMYAKASVRASTEKLGPAAGVVATLCFVLVAAIAAIPHLGVILTSVTVPGRWYGGVLPDAWTGEHYVSALTHPLAAGSIRNSLFYAFIAMVVDVVLGVLIARILVRTKVWGRGILDALSMLPLAVPGLVMAFGYVAVTLRWPFGKDDPLEGWLDVIGAEPNPALLLIIAYSVRRLPYVVRAAVAGLQQTSVELEEAALNVGASRGVMVRKVVVPLIMANLIAGGLLAFSFAMLEVSDSLILAQREEHYPMTKAIFILFERLGDGQAIASAMGVWAMAILAVTLIGSSLLMGRKMGAIFRV